MLSSSAVYYNRSCVCVCGGQAGGVCNGWTVFVAGEQAVSVSMITRNCVHRSSPNWVVGKGSDSLQLIKFWPSCAPGKGVCGVAKFFGSALLQPARSVCVSQSAFFHFLMYVVLLRNHSFFAFNRQY